MAEEFIKKQIEQFVLNQMTPIHGSRVRADRKFLILQWRVGALQVLNPEQAFPCASGFGQTMSVLYFEGRTIVK
jgi:hypothetical protein